ncbi:hypothetical protein Slin14017_G098570 [Septoria linicola]|nr:hypothetical protein Slin14017_G098570 [Septoria linicola]
MAALPAILDSIDTAIYPGLNEPTARALITRYISSGCTSNLARYIKLAPSDTIRNQHLDVSGPGDWTPALQRMGINDELCEAIMNHEFEQLRLKDSADKFTPQLVATEPPMGMTPFYKGITLSQASRMWTYGSLTLKPLESRNGGDFSDQRAFYFTPSISFAKLCARWLALRSPSSDGPCIIRIDVPNNLIESEKTLEMFYPSESWKKGILQTKKLESLTRVLPAAKDKDLIIADTSTGDHLVYKAVGENWREIDDRHVLWLQDSGKGKPTEAETKRWSKQQQKQKQSESTTAPQNKKLVQYVFWDELRFRIEDECAGKVIILHPEAKIGVQEPRRLRSSSGRRNDDTTIPEDESDSEDAESASQASDELPTGPEEASDELQPGSEEAGDELRTGPEEALSELPLHWRQARGDNIGSQDQHKWANDLRLGEMTQEERAMALSSVAVCGTLAHSDGEVAEKEAHK